jgi:hypothetical protein
VPPLQVLPEALAFLRGQLLEFPEALAQRLLLLGEELPPAFRPLSNLGTLFRRQSLPSAVISLGCDAGSLGATCGTSPDSGGSSTAPRGEAASSAHSSPGCVAVPPARVVFQCCKFSCTRVRSSGVNDSRPWSVSPEGGAGAWAPPGTISQNSSVGSRGISNRFMASPSRPSYPSWRCRRVARFAARPTSVRHQAVGASPDLGGSTIPPTSAHPSRPPPTGGWGAVSAGPSPWRWSTPPRSHRQAGRSPAGAPVWPSSTRLGSTWAVKLAQDV